MCWCLEAPVAGEADSRQSKILSTGDVKAALHIRNEAKKRRVTLALFPNSNSEHKYGGEIPPAQSGSQGRQPLSTHTMAASWEPSRASIIPSWSKAAMA